MALLYYSPPQHPYLDFVYQDNDIAVLNKQPGLLSVPGKAREHKDSLQTRVQRVYPTASVVHRLDMATSGIMIFALNKKSHVSISKQLENRQTQKHYYAMVYGIPKEPEGSVDLPLRCDWPNRPKQMVDQQQGKKALTKYQTIKQYQNYSLIKLIPVTGRSHQLRVHMLSIGHPILGDKLYAHSEALALSSRLCLHAESHRIIHPRTQQNICFASPFDFPTLT